ncbi:MAG: hypothetical protein E2581_08135 [Pseudomonas sp.]|nr:hypothetical protein C4Q26_23330 [Pseudomonas sp. SWI44]MPS98454.1 hypothetical protein [Pseudomonas sp.]
MLLREFFILQRSVRSAVIFVGTGSPANTGEALAIHRAACFVGEPALPPSIAHSPAFLPNLAGMPCSACKAVVAIDPSPSTKRANVRSCT